MILIGFSLKSILYQKYADDVREADTFDEEANIDLLITPPRKGTDCGVMGGIYFASQAFQLCHHDDALAQVHGLFYRWLHVPS